MNSQIQLSIVIPVYNVEEYIEECLQSIIAQILDNFLIEIIVVNDGTPDNSITIVEKIRELHPDIIKIINQENQGLSLARNNGLKIAKGNYVWFVDSDDYLLPNALNDIKSYIDSYPDVEVFSSFLYRFSESREIPSESRKIMNKMLSGKEYLFNKMPIGASPRFIFSRNFLLRNNLHFQPHILHEDAIFGYEMLYLVNKICIMDNPIYAYRIRVSRSIMSSITIRSAYDLMKSYTLLKEFQMEKVAKEDQKKFSVAIFGIIYSLLDFCKNLYKDKTYKEFLNYNRSLIKKDAWNVFVHNFLEINALLIAIRPELFSYLLRCRQKIINYRKG